MSVVNQLREAWGTFRRHWLLFLALHLLAGLLLSVLLGPLLSLLLGWLVTASGNVALTDQDILYAVLSPLGFVLLLVGLGLWLTITVFETAAMLLAADRLAAGQRPSLGRLLGRVLLRLRGLFRLSLELALRLLALAAPFLLVAGWAYLHYLTEFDINFYLAERPPAFRTAALIIAAALFLLAVLLLRALAGWFLALPLLLLGGVPAKRAIAESRQHLDGHRGEVAAFLVAWALLFMALFAASGALLQLCADAVVGAPGLSLQTLAWTVGGLVLAWSVVNVFIGLFAGVSLAVGLLLTWRRRVPAATVVEAPKGTRKRPEARRVAMPWVALALIGVAVLQVFALARQLAEFDGNERPQIMAHRGASWDAPENTLAAIEAAIREGADWVEIDVQETSDGRVLVIHDRDLMKVGGSPLRVFDGPFEALRAVDIGSWKDPSYADQRVPLLAEVLELARRRVKLNIELKYYGREERLEERVARLVEAHGMVDDVVLMSLSLPGVRKMKALRPDWTVGLLSSVALGDLTRLDADFFAVNAQFASRPFIERARARGKAVYTWTVNDPAGISAMIGRGVDGIITDRPGLARRVWEERRELAVHERLLVRVASALGSDYGEAP